VRFVFEDALLMLHDRIDRPLGGFAQDGGLYSEFDTALSNRNDFDKILAKIVADVTDFHGVIQVDIPEPCDRDIRADGINAERDKGFSRSSWVSLF